MNKKFYLMVIIKKIFYKNVDIIIIEYLFVNENKLIIEFKL